MDELSPIEIEGADAEFETTPELEANSDLAFEPRSEGPEFSEFGDPPRRRGPWLWLVPILLLLAAAIGWWFWSQQHHPTEPARATLDPAPAAAVPIPTPASPEPEPPFVVPAMAESDAVIAQLVSTLSAHPELTRWLATDALVERFVAAIDNIAEGESPRVHVAFAGPKSGFKVEKTGSEVTIDPASYQRYDTFTAVVRSLDTAGTARLLRNLEPLLNEGYRNLGYPEGSFRDTFFNAVDELLAVPVRDTPLQLKSKILSYHYRDPELEKLTDAQKHLLRMGPENIRAIQAKLRELRTALLAGVESVSPAK